MTQQGLPDFQQPMRGDNFQIFTPFEGRGSYLLLSDRLDVAVRDDGHPDFLLELLRGEDPTRPPAPYGVLDLKVEPHYPVTEGLALLRSRLPGATLDLATFSAGFLRIAPTGGVDTTPADLQTPIPLAWNGLTTGRFTLKLSESSALFVKDALQNTLLALSAIAEMELIGIAPRLAVSVQFNPATLLSELVPLGSQKRQVARDDILSFFRGDLRSLPLQVTGEIRAREDFAQVMTDWVRVRFGTFVPSPVEDGKAYIALLSPDEVGSGSFTWDLSLPLQAPRPLILKLDPLAAARQVVKDQGQAAVVRESVVPVIETGVFLITIAANIPTHRPGVLATSVTLTAPPHLPSRPQAVVVSAELKPPEDSARILLRLSPIEKPEYLFSTSLIVNSSAGIRQVEGVQVPHSGEMLYLGPSDFPLDFIPIEADKSLLALAVIQGSCQYTEAGSIVTQAFTLDLDRSAVALTLPKGVEGARLNIDAHARDSTKTLSLRALPAQALRLGLYSFREYGPQHIEIACVFDDTAPLFAIDLLPEGHAETADEISVLSFTPAQPEKEWEWVAVSPFHAGYRYRVHADAGTVPAPWSDILSPFDNLTLHVTTHTGGGA